jgi:hypothetical protein
MGLNHYSVGHCTVIPLFLTIHKIFLKKNHC